MKRDAAGIELRVGDYIAYAKAEGRNRCPTLTFAQIHDIKDTWIVIRDMANHRTEVSARGRAFYDTKNAIKVTKRQAFHPYHILPGYGIT